MRTGLSEGKIPPEILRPLLPDSSDCSDVIIGPEYGEDAAVVKGRRRLIITADPVTFTEGGMGTYVVAINVNDIIAMGGTPLYLTTTILLPVGCRESRLQTLFDDISNSASRAGVHWVGGHTEVTSAVTRSVISGHVVGVLTGKPTSTGGARPGERIVMTKWAGLEGSTILAREHPDRANRLLGLETADRVRNWLRDPGISISREGAITSGLKLGAAHDPTEGGLATALHEIAERSQVGLEIVRESVSIKPETETLCRDWSIDPLGLLSSGVFLFTARPAVADSACRLLRKGGIPACVIGCTTENPGDRVLTEGDKLTDLPRYVRDELLKTAG